MRQDAIYLLQDGERLERVSHTGYVTEEQLQALLAQHPELLAGEQFDTDDPPRWLMVSREAGIPDGDGAADRWSLDHLLLDHNAVPTFVEVKRSSDTRIRREVVGQMLDYAANATRYWPVDRIRMLAAAQLGGSDALDEEVAGLTGATTLDETTDVESYWEMVDENLRSGRVRLLFVADELPSELRRIIEFLNEHMSRIEVLGVEIRLYQGRNMQALVPRIVGQTERARQDKRIGSVRKVIDETRLLADCPDWARPFVGDILRQARENAFIVNWGEKSAIIRVPSRRGRVLSVLYAYPPGALGRDAPTLEIYLKGVEQDVAHQLRADLTALDGIVESGNFTLRMSLSEELLPVARKAVSTLWEACRRLV